MGSLGIIAGVGLTLFGVRFLRKGLDRLLGGKLVAWVSRMTQNRVRAFAAGVAMGVVAPSSTGLALLGSQLLGNGGVSAMHMLAVLFGASIGLTGTVHVLTIPIASAAAWLIALGVFGFQFCKRDLWRGLGQCALGLGFLFLSMRMIGEGAAVLARSEDLRGILVILRAHPGAIAVAVTVLAVLLQSSTATIALGIGLATAELLAPLTVISWVIATNLGLGVTSLLAGWRQLDSKRVGLGNLLGKAVVAIPALFAAQQIELGLVALSGSLAQQAALLHTGFNLVVGLIALPLLGPLYRLTCFLIPAPQRDRSTPPESFLDLEALETPSLALARATRETLRMTDHVRNMLKNFWEAFTTNSLELCRRVQLEDDAVDRMNFEIKDYLSRVGENRSREDMWWQFTLLSFANELEAAGDLVDKHLCDNLLKLPVENRVLQPADQAALADVYRHVLRTLDQAAAMLTARGTNEAEAFIEEKQRFNDWCRKLQQEHYERLAGASQSQLASSTYFLDSLNALRRINSHLSSMGYACASSRKGKRAETA